MSKNKRLSTITASPNSDVCNVMATCEKLTQLAGSNYASYRVMVKNICEKNPTKCNLYREEK